jgi:AcrR family transcriptional regulator
VASARRSSAKKKPAGRYHHGDLRRALLDVAGAMLEEDGPEAFTMREAARRVGVDHRAAYRHFEDRRALLAVVAEDGYRELVEVIERELALAAPSDHGARLGRLARAYVEFANRRPGRYQVMTGPRVNEDGRFPGVETALADAFHLVRRELDAGIATGAFRPVDVTEVVLTLWAGMHGVASLIAMRRLRVRREGFGDFAERAIGHTVRGLLRDDTELD